ncbi:carbohydrate ABC transporter permease [Actinotalea sp.]|uniref:carbohydrate ABC transporter permease n=1 Tax=Actinotalea sp. TaxID=1872145 RepID=UPI0035640CA7
MLTIRSRGRRVVLQIVLTLMTLPFFLPLVAMVQGSLGGLGWGNYAAVLSVPELPLFFRNSVIIAAVTIAIVYGASMLAAFGFAKLRVKGKEVMFWMMMVALTLPGVVLLAPMFATTIALGIYNTYWAVILPLAALQIPFAVLLARNFAAGIPDELIDATRIDGASTLKGFWYVILPMMRPIGAAIVIFTMIGAWNEYLLPLVFLVDPSTQTITQLPSFFVGQFSNDQTKVLASAVITAIPEVVAYVSLQRLFERGLGAGALK